MTIAKAKDHRNAAELAYVAEVGRLIERREEKERQHEADLPWRRLLAYGVPQRVVSLLRSRKVQENDAMRVLSMIPSDRWCMAIVAGPPGGGKTVGACWWLERKIPQLECEKLGAKLTPRRFIRIPDLSTMKPWSPEYLEVREARKLVLDDLGMEAKGDQRFLSNFDAFLDHRTSNGLPTVITTNIAPKDIRKRYGDRVGSRLTEAAQLVQTDTDYRAAGRPRAEEPAPAPPASPDPMPPLPGVA